MDLNSSEVKDVILRAALTAGVAFAVNYILRKSTEVAEAKIAKK